MVSKKHVFILKIAVQWLTQGMRELHSEVALSIKSQKVNLGNKRSEGTVLCNLYNIHKII